MILSYVCDVIYRGAQLPTSGVSVLACRSVVISIHCSLNGIQQDTMGACRMATMRDAHEVTLIEGTTDFPSRIWSRSRKYLHCHGSAGVFRLVKMVWNCCPSERSLGRCVFVRGCTYHEKIIRRSQRRVGVQNAERFRAVGGCVRQRHFECVHVISWRWRALDVVVFIR